ncbi:MAG: FHA domain-containing protein [Phototrophicaceae bacterium]
MSDDNQKSSTDDLSKSEYGKTWAVSEDSSISQALSEVLRAALEDQPDKNQPGILLYIANQTKPIVLTAQSIIHLGRVESDDPAILDLSEYYGRELGVSRNHAELAYQNGSYLIKDLGSTNGTWINGEKIPPYRQIQLHDSDQLRLGHFTMLVKFNI